MVLSVSTTGTEGGSPEGSHEAVIKRRARAAHGLHSASSQNPFPFLGLTVGIVTVIAVSLVPSSKRCKKVISILDVLLIILSVKPVFLVGCVFCCCCCWLC